MDCGLKLTSKLYPDSTIATKQQCGRTKAESLVENILANKSIEMVLQEMKVSSDSPVYFSIATDASNKGNRKLYPIAVRYFDINRGVRDRIVEFYEDSKEASKNIYDQIMTCVNSHGLNVNFCSSYSADNASVNYGDNNSVFQKLCLINHNLIKSNCNAHVIHNTGRNACKLLSFDVENLILKVFAEFSHSAKAVDILKTCFDDFDMAYENVLRHVVTRWLSLFPAVERIIKIWPAVKQYFLNQGEDDTDKTIWMFVKDQADEMNDDLNSHLTLPECYLYFVHHFMFQLTRSIKLLEKDSTMISHVHGILTSLRGGLQSRLKDKYFGAKVNQSLVHLPSYQRKKFETEAITVYQRAIAYLEKWYDYENTPFQHFSVINLDKEDLQFQDFLQAAKAVKIDLNEDVLYDEIISISTVIQPIKNLELALDLKWVKIFATSQQFQELPKLVGKILSIPISNAYVEKVFSIMNNVWTDLRNRMRTELVKAELFTKLNFDMTCDEFEKYLSHPDQTSLLKKAMSNEKYTWKKKV